MCVNFRALSTNQSNYSLPFVCCLCAVDGVVRESGPVAHALRLEWLFIAFTQLFVHSYPLEDMEGGRGNGGAWSGGCIRRKEM